MKKEELFLDFDTCLDRKSDNSIKINLQRICEEVESALGAASIKSIILTGAATRGEASALSYDKGVDIFSDYDLLVVVNEVTVGIYNKLKKVSRTLVEEFSRENFSPSVDVTPVSIGHLSAMKPSMFALELKQCGRVLYGDDCKSCIPNVCPEDIPRQDALQMLHNRITGVLEYFDPLVFLGEGKQTEQQVKFLIYHIAKNNIDLGSSLLCFEKMYASGYVKRADILKNDFQRYGFSEKYSGIPNCVEKWTKFKLIPDIKSLLQERDISGYSCEYLIDLAKTLLNEHIFFMEAVWKYELQKLYGTKETDTIRLIDIFFAYHRSVSFSRRVKSCLDYIVKPKGVHMKFWGCVKAIRGHPAIPSLYCLADVLFFFVPCVLQKTTVSARQNIVKFAEKLPFSLPANDNSFNTWNAARKQLVVLWRALCC
ncbi:MAG: hypothetical protein JRI96_07735 [Deltaproteobacteria bacterium]|nr:hypothetical protein [Deltaproteobacteria bacterium]